MKINSSQKYYDYLIVGAGFAGATLAERLATQLNKKVLIIDKRPHIGGNAYDCLNDAGVLFHLYGPHIFHTNSERIIEYLSNFTEWIPYEHRVLADVDGKLVPVPINLTTINTLYGLNLEADGAEAFLASRAEPVAKIATSEDVVVSKVGRDLYQKFFRGYTRKQWGLDPSELDKTVTARVPTRTTTDDRYFNDTYQCMPTNGYTELFKKMLSHPNIDIMLDTDYFKVKDYIEFQNLIYTGPIDEYFNYCYGKLPYRSLKFEHKTLQQEWFQAVGVVNYPKEETPYTRITEYKHLTGQKHRYTSLTWEYPCADGDPYYPIPRQENHDLYKKYEALAEQTPNVVFLGRLGSYRYYNMDQIVGQALAVFNRLSTS
ncbi:MAG: UDP-galactopyranose mutase [Burkholderiales bacterium]|nr:UDP-galactopyranose mutase [Burkholderiales bacterium]